MMKTIELSTQDANVLANLLNVACKQLGLEGAEACLYFINKLKNAQDSIVEMPKLDNEI